jgi:kynureninase
MPTISMFYGIIIRMYCAPGEHNPPHIHAYYQNDTAVVNIKQCEVTQGKLPRKKERLVLAWVEIHQEALLANWELASNGELPFSIDPLR